MNIGKANLPFPCREQRVIKRAFINMCSTFIDFLLLLGEVLDLGDNLFLKPEVSHIYKADNIHLSFYSNSLSSVMKLLTKICLHVLAAQTFSVD